jgi:hypothetical protein
MKTQKMQLLENKLRKMVREELKNSNALQEVDDVRDAREVLKLIYSKMMDAQSGKHIDELLDYLEKSYTKNRDADSHRRVSAMKKAYNDFIFGLGELYGRKIKS